MKRDKGDFPKEYEMQEFEAFEELPEEALSKMETTEKFNCPSKYTCNFPKCRCEINKNEPEQKLPEAGKPYREKESGLKFYLVPTDNKDFVRMCGENKKEDWNCVDLYEFWDLFEEIEDHKSDEDWKKRCEEKINNSDKPFLEKVFLHLDFKIDCEILEALTPKHLERKNLMISRSLDFKHI